MGISLKELEKSILSLESAIELYKKATTDSDEKKAFRDACIQRFEYTLELSWKVSMKILGSQTAASKVAVREMARNNLIKNPENWLQFIDSRNNTSHSYDEDIAQKVYADIEKFIFEAQQLYKTLESIK